MSPRLASRESESLTRPDARPETSKVREDPTTGRGDALSSLGIPVSGRRMTAGFVTIAQAAEYLGLSTKSIRRLIARGTLPASRIKGITAVRIRRADLDRLAQPLAEA